MNFKGNQLRAYSNILNAAIENNLTNECHEVGYNEMNGKVWMWFEDLNITITAPDYRPEDVSFYVLDYANENEHGFSSYEKAVEYLNRVA